MQKKLAKTIANEDKALETFGLTKKIQRILKEQNDNVQTRQQA